MGAQYASGVQDFQGAGRIAQQELKQDLPTQSTMSNRAQQGADFRTGTQEYIKKLQLKRAQMFGQAGTLSSPELSDYDYDKQVNDIYSPGGAQYVSGQAPRVTRPDTSIKSPADVAKLPPGRAFVIPDGSGRIGYAGINGG